MQIYLRLVGIALASVVVSSGVWVRGLRGPVGQARMGLKLINFKRAGPVAFPILGSRPVIVNRGSRDCLPPNLGISGFAIFFTN